MMTSLIVMLKLPNFGNMTAATVRLKSHDEISLVTSWTEIMTL